jgi:hypothetical protein
MAEESTIPFDFKRASKEELQKKYNEIAKQVGDDQFFTKKELHFLPEVLQDGENVIAFSSGLMDGNTWLITLTDRRLIFLDKGMIYCLKQSFIPLDKVNSVSGQTGIFFGTISISHGSKTHKIEKVWKKTVRNFTNLVQEQLEIINNAVRNPRNSNQAPSPETDKYTQIEKLFNLKEKGILSEEEFELEKSKLLGS